MQTGENIIQSSAHNPRPPFTMLSGVKDLLNPTVISGESIFKTQGRSVK